MKRRIQTLIVVAVLVFFTLLGSYEVVFQDENAQFVHLRVIGSAHASLVVLYDSKSVGTDYSGQTLIVNVPPNTNLTVVASPLSNFEVTGWHVTGTTETKTYPNAVTFNSGVANSDITIFPYIINE